MYPEYSVLAAANEKSVYYVPQAVGVVAGSAYDGGNNNSGATMMVANGSGTMMTMGSSNGSGTMMTMASNGSGATMVLADGTLVVANPMHGMGGSPASVKRASTAIRELDEEFGGQRYGNVAAVNAAHDAALQRAASSPRGMPTQQFGPSPMRTNGPMAGSFATIGAPAGAVIAGTAYEGTNPGGDFVCPQCGKACALFVWCQ